MGHTFQNSSYFALQYNLHHAVINYGSAVLVRIDQCLRTGTVNEARNTRGKLKDPLERILRENGIRMPPRRPVVFQCMPWLERSHTAS